MSSGYANRGGWRTALLVALALFLLTRISALTAFPIFNDEAIYLQYSQRIHDDWEKNKFISMNGEFTDWKPPLQYWLAAPFIEWGNDPLLVGRIVAAFFSIAGILGAFLFTKELFTEREGVLAAWLYLLCPPVLLHNDQFTAETFLFSTAPLFYWALLKAMRWNTRDWIWGIVAALFGATLLLLKQSGFSLVAVSILLPLARVPKKNGRRNHRATQTAWNFGLVGIVIIVSLIAVHAILPAEFNAARDHFNSRWVLSLADLATLPIETWRANLGVVADYITSSYSWGAVMLASLFAWFAMREKNLAELTLVLMGLASAAGVVLLLRGFNEYIFNTAIIAVLLPLLARLGIAACDRTVARKAAWVRSAILVCGGATLVYWVCQDTLMVVSAGRFIERSSAWARANYLETWSTGFGVKETVMMLEKEKAPGIVFADTQWGNPRTALEVYRGKRFPNLRIVPISREFLEAAGARKLAEDAKKMAPVHFVIFSADKSGLRGQWQDVIEREMCTTRTEIRISPRQKPIIVCRF